MEIEESSEMTSALPPIWLDTRSQEQEASFLIHQMAPKREISSILSIPVRSPIFMTFFLEIVHM